MGIFSRFILRYAGMVLLAGILLAGAGAYYSVQLYKNLRTDLEELLPETARSEVDLDEVTRRLESIDNLAVLVFSDDTKGSRRFVTDLAERLKKAPKDVIASVEYRIDRELQFFRARRTLYMDTPDLVRVRNYIRDRIEYEKALYNPLNIFREEEIPEPQLDFVSLERKYSGKISAYSRFPDGFYATPDEKKRVVLVYMPGKSSGIGSTGKLKEYVVKTVSQLNPQSYAADIRIQYTGGVQNTIEEQSALVADLELSTIIVTVVVAIAMWMFFRAGRAAFSLMASLLMGTAWTFGASYFAVGYLNANSAFLGSIVIGNGINFGIIALARYLEERRLGHSNVRAVRVSMSHTATATWTAALAAGLSYGSLMLTGFRGFRQFGVIGLIGMVLCWISAFTVMPAMLTLLDRWKPIMHSGRSKPKAWLSEATARFVSRWPKPIWIASFVVTLISFVAFARHQGEILETDLSKLRNKESMATGSGFWSTYVDEIFGRYLTPIVILPRSREHAVRIADLLKEQKEREGETSMIASVQTLEDFVPRDQVEKIRLIKEIRALLPPRLLHRLSPDDQRRVREFLTEESLRPVRVRDLPELVLSKFTERNGTIGKLVLVEPPIGGQTLKKDNLTHFVKTLRDTADSVAPGTPVAGTLPISADMIDAISRDGPRATAFAFLAVILLVVFLFRNVRTIALVLFALILGVIWMGGIIFGFGLKINFLNFIALPITFGIGIDYGVNIFQRYRQEGGASILRVIRGTGGAVGLCSFTTVVGYGSLLIAQNQAFVSFGLLSVIGELTCLFAAVLSLPAYLLLRDRYRSAR